MGLKENLRQFLAKPRVGSHWRCGSLLRYWSLLEIMGLLEGVVKAKGGVD